jgi:formate hydrogenlyase subunit 3/multisubunit Na+/H+ antiporter MnhD subunit
MTPEMLVLPWALLGMRFGLDAVTQVFLGLTLVLWALAGVYAMGYLSADPRRRSFMLFFALTFSGNLGLVLARDVASFYLFFALMTFAAYGLVIHTREPAALRAGRVYIALAVLGEALLLAGLMLAASSAPTLEIADVRAGAAASPQRGAVVALLLAGFGVKAGALGVHMWLPLAHPVAPTPASAVLSGAMIKAGLLGWLHFLPLGESALPGWGIALAAAGLAAAFYAALAGVMQDDAKTVLAYSSISQMGIITVALGAGLAVPGAAAPAIAAAAFYALHHGLAKGALFLGVGIAPAVRQPARFAALLLPALALAGMPQSSGALAKYALKSSLSELAWAAPLLPFAAVGTTLLMARFLFLVQAGGAKHATRSRRALVAWLACVAASVALAWLPLRALELPAAVEPSWSDAWPILLGAALSVAVASAGGGLGRLRVPPGDVLVPLMAAATGSHRGAHALGARLGTVARRGFARLQARWREGVKRLRSACDAGEARLRAAGSAAALLVIAVVFLFLQ